MNDPLLQLFETLKNSQHLISDERSAQLIQLASDISESIAVHDEAKVIAVCTHNSRRSQLMQIMLQFVADQLGIKKLSTFSGGTEGTAFNYRMVDALRHFGFDLLVDKPGENPMYKLFYTEELSKDDFYFSKRYDNAYNPQKDFIAVMVCTEADEACPLVPGAFRRLSLPYVDPKEADDTDQEAITYQDKVLEIGREMYFVAKNLKSA